jgi:hypothetical protein
MGDEMSRVCSMNLGSERRKMRGIRRIHVRYWCESQKEFYHWEGQDIGGGEY